MNNLSYHLQVVLLPLIITNVLHMLVVKKDFFKNLKTPVWSKAFGKNKTLRGFVFVPLANAFTLMAVATVFRLDVNSPALLGLLLGFAYVLFELPNSLLKRRLGIASGEKHERFNLLFSLFDKTDSALGVTLIYFLLGCANFYLSSILFVVCVLTHIVLSHLLVTLRIKKAF